MKRSDLDRDAGYILDAIKARDYEIPTNSQILKIIFSKLIIVYALQISFIVLDFILNTGSYGYHFFDTFVLAVGSNLFFSLAFLMTTYSAVCMNLIMGEEIRKQSMLLQIIDKKVRFYSCLLVFINTVIGIILLWAGERFVAGLGFSWFATFLVSSLLLQGSMSRYMTPAVVSSLSKVRELVSGNAVTTEDSNKGT